MRRPRCWAVGEGPWPARRAGRWPSLASVIGLDQQRYGLLDLAKGTVHWLTDLDGKADASALPAWSPDGRYLAVLDEPKGASQYSIAIVDTTDVSVRKLPLDPAASYCADFYQVGWHDADTLSLPIGHNVSEAQPPTYSGVRLISAVDGSPEGTIDLPGTYASRDDWSTDGRYVTLLREGGVTMGTSVIYDTLDKREVRNSPNPLNVWWVSATEYLEFAGGELRVVQLDGTVTSRYGVPALDGADHLVLVRR